MKKIVLAVLTGTILLSAANTALGAEAVTQATHKRLPGSLNVTADTTLSLGESTFNFEGELSPLNSLGTVTIVDTRGSKVGWTLDLTVSDWTNETGVAMDSDGDGVTTGKFYFFGPALTDITRVAGQSTTGLIPGTDGSLSPTTQTINILTAPNGSGQGKYTINGMEAQQYIPPEQEIGTYQTTLTYTIS